MLTNNIISKALEKALEAVVAEIKAGTGVEEINIFIDANGRVEFIHDDAVTLALHNLGPTQITRASNVDPDEAGQWWADMTPIAWLYGLAVSEPDLLLGPFATRGEALAAERAWIEQFLAHHVKKEVSHAGAIHVPPLRQEQA